MRILLLLHTVFPCYKSCSWRSPQSWVEVYPFVEMPADMKYEGIKKFNNPTPPHLNITSLLLSLLVGEVAEPLAGHPEEVDQLSVMGVGHEHLYQALHKPCAMLVVPMEQFSATSFQNCLHVMCGLMTSYYMCCIQTTSSLHSREL